MDPRWQTFFFALALVFFFLDAVSWRPIRTRVVPMWTPLGLMCFTIPFLYSAAATRW